MDIIKDTFKAKYVGRGIWHIQHSLISSIINSDLSKDDAFNKLFVIYMCFIVYCKYIYCGVCRHHAAIFIKRNSISKKMTIENPEIQMDLFNWMYEFHKEANKNASKGSPSKNEVIRYYIHDTDTENIKKRDFSYEEIQVGMWHYFFILASRCQTHEQVSYIYYLILEFMPSLPDAQRKIFTDFCEKNRFSEALEDDLSDDEILMCFFEWIYAVYSEINTSSNLEVYDLETLREVYYYLDVCNDDCDK